MHKTPIIIILALTLALSTTATFNEAQFDQTKTCGERTQVYKTVYAISQLCITNLAPTWKYTTGKEIHIACGFDAKLYKNCHWTQCGPEGCKDTCEQVTSPHGITLTAADNLKEQRHTCFKYVKDGTNAAWSAYTYQFTPVYVPSEADMPPTVQKDLPDHFDAIQPEPSVLTTLGKTTLNLSWWRQIWESIQQFFQDIGLGSLAQTQNSASSGGGGTG